MGQTEGGQRRDNKNGFGGGRNEGPTKDEPRSKSEDRGGGKSAMGESSSGEGEVTTEPF